MGMETRYIWGEKHGIGHGELPRKFGFNEQCLPIGIQQASLFCLIY